MSTELENRVDRFFENIDSLDKKDKISLYRCVNRDLDSVRIDSIIAYNKVMVTSFKRDIWFFIASQYSWQNRNGAVNKVEELPLIIKKFDSNDPIRKHFNRLLSMELSEETLFFTRLRQLICIVTQKGYNVDFKKLLFDLISWNSDTNTVQHKWAEKVYENI